MIVGVNYFGMSELVEGLEGALAHGQKPAVTLIGSVASVHPGMDKLPMVSAMLAGDEQQALAQADAMAMPQAAYAGSKYAIAVFARRKAVALGPKGIRINVVAPGAVETPLLDASRADARYGDAIRKFVALQENNDCIYCVVDLHAITAQLVHEDLRGQIVGRLARRRASDSVAE